MVLKLAYCGAEFGFFLTGDEDAIRISWCSARPRITGALYQPGGQQEERPAHLWTQWAQVTHEESIQI